MDTYQIEIIDPKAKTLLDDLANMNLITVKQVKPKELFKKLLDKVRSTDGNAPTLDEITKEVEAVRGDRYARK